MLSAPSRLCVRLTNRPPMERIKELYPYRSGPVAQLGARFHGMEEVVGSIPTRSTNHINHLEAPPLRDFVASLSQIPKPLRGPASQPRLSVVRKQPPAPIPISAERQESARVATSANPTHPHLRQQKFGAEPDRIGVRSNIRLAFAYRTPIRYPTRLVAAHGCKSFNFMDLTDNRVV